MGGRVGFQNTLQNKKKAFWIKERHAFMLLSLVVFFYLLLTLFFLSNGMDDNVLSLRCKVTPMTFMCTLSPPHLCPVLRTLGCFVTSNQEVGVMVQGINHCQ